MGTIASAHSHMESKEANAIKDEGNSELPETGELRGQSWTEIADQ